MLATLAWAGAALALREAMDCTRTRHAFGGPLAEKQVIRHKLARMTTLVDVPREYVRRVAYRVRPGDDCTPEVSVAKNFRRRLP